MAINPLNSGSNYISQVQPQPQSQADRVAAEKTREEAKKTAETSVPVQPSVSPEPQKVGSVIDVKV